MRTAMLRSDRSGFALPMAILVIGVLTVGVAAAFTRVESEQRVNRDREAAVDAFALAQTGLERFLVSRSSLGFTSAPPAVSESARINLGGGYADVVLRRVRPAVGADDPLYVVRSHGVTTQTSATLNRSAEHTVAQYAFFRPGQMQVRSAWTAITGLVKNGGSGTISGEDECGVMPDVAGVTVPNNGYQQNGGAPVPDGTPPIEELGTVSETADAINIDWDAIVNHGAVTPDLVIPGDTWPSFADPNYWPVIRINGDFSVPTSGRGTLIVTGDLTVSGSTKWDGILLVGGVTNANGNNTVRGAVISALNTKLGMTVGTSDVGNGTKTYVYNSCNVANALARFGTLIPMQNTWVDNWPTW